MKKNSTSLSISDVKRIGQLAKLSLTEKEVRKFQKQLLQILDFVNHLSLLDTRGIPPTNQVTGLENVFRSDTIKPSLSQNEVLANAPDQYNGYFKVKTVF